MYLYLTTECLVNHNLPDQTDRTVLPYQLIFYQPAKPKQTHYSSESVCPEKDASPQKMKILEILIINMVKKFTNTQSKYVT